MTIKRLYFILMFAVFSGGFQLHAQTAPTQRPNSNAGKPVEIDFAEVYERIVVGDTIYQRLAREVELKQGDLYIYCDEATIRNNDFVRATGNVVLLQNDTLEIFADSMRYYANQELAFLYGRVVLVNGVQKLFTDSLRYNLATKQAHYSSRAKLTDGQAQLSSMRGLYDVEAKRATFRDSVFVVGDDFSLISDTLSFNTEKRIVYFEGPTVMATSNSRIYCEDGFYNILDSIGVFKRNAQVARGTQRTMADAIYYNGQLDEFVLIGNARVVDEQRRAVGDTIRYNERSNKTVLAGNATFTDADQRVSGERINYDGNSKTFSSIGRVNLSEPPYLLSADSISFDDAAGLAFVHGNVNWKDTASQRAIIAEDIIYKRSGEYVKAFGGRPIFSTVVEQDSIHISADTLITYQRPFLQDSLARNTISDSTLAAPPSNEQAREEGKEPRADSASTNLLGQELKPIPVDSVGQGMASRDSLALAKSQIRPSKAPDSVRLVLAYNNVRIYKSNLQAVSDSMAFNSLDSAITLYGMPLVWSDTSQFMADTITVKLRNEQVDRVYLRSGAMIINSSDEIFYNQIKGRQVDVEFLAGDIDRMLVRGNAESVYYITDEQKAYVGVNHVKSARMRMQFGEGQLRDIYFYDQPEGAMEPIAPGGQEPKLLDDFRWEIKLRPKSKDDLQ